MSKHLPTPTNDLEEAAQGHDLFRAPGDELLIEQALDQAEASGWLPEDHIYDWPSVDTTQQIVNRRRDLYAAMQKLESSVARASGNGDWAEDVREALVGLDDALGRHVFAVEAPNGLFAEVVERAPHMAAAVADLRAEHKELVAATRSAIEAMGAGGPDELRRVVLHVLGLVAVHRQNGAELLFDAYNLDLAGGE